MRIFWDVDGPLYDFVDAVARWFHLSLDIPAEQMPVPDRWNIWECWGMTRQDWWANVDLGIEAGYIFTLGVPRRDAVRVSQELRRRGHTQHIVTARGASPLVTEERRQITEASTRNWLDGIGFVYDTLEFSHDKTVREVDVAIEDNLDNYDALAAQGVEVALIDTPWNQDDGSRNRVYSLLEFLAFVDQVAELRGMTVDRGEWATVAPA